MSLSHSPSLVLPGLSLCLDAANTKSYPGSGTTWTDLSGRGNNGTLVNGVGYSGDNLGSLVFDGVDDSCILSNKADTQFPHNSPWSFSLIYKIISQNTTFPGLIRKGNATGSGIIIFYDSLDRVFWKHNNSQTAFTQRNINTIKHIAFTYSGSGNVNCYVNSSLFGSVGTMISTDSSSSLELGRADGMGNVQIYNFMKYNRALTAQEIQQNFNALKSRYI
jgi:hypothetical protein